MQGFLRNILDEEYHTKVSQRGMLFMTCYSLMRSYRLSWDCIYILAALFEYGDSCGFGNHHEYWGIGCNHMELVCSVFQIYCCFRYLFQNLQNIPKNIHHLLFRPAKTSMSKNLDGYIRKHICYILAIFTTSPRLTICFMT